MRKLLRTIKKGFTIVEVAVAMSVITIVAITTIGVVKSSRIEAATSTKYALSRLQASNALEVFKFAESSEEFYSTLLGMNAIIVKSGNTYTIEDSLYKLTIVTIYNDDDRDTFNALCYDNKNNLLFRTTYIKAE